MVRLITFSFFSILTLNTFANERAIYDLSDAVKVLTNTLETDNKTIVLNRLLDAKHLMSEARIKLDNVQAQTPLEIADKKIINLINSTVDTSDTHFMLSHKKIKSIINDLKTTIQEEKK